MIEAKTLDKRYDWFRPLVESEQREASLRRNPLQDATLCAALRATKGILRETFLGPLSYINASTCRGHTASFGSSMAPVREGEFRHERSSFTTY